MKNFTPQEIQDIKKSLKQAGPFYMVTGDSVSRLTPGSRQMLNSTESWLTSQPAKSGHQMRTIQNHINQLPELIEFLTRGRNNE